MAVVGGGAGGDGPPGSARGDLARGPLARADRVHLPLPAPPAAVRAHARRRLHEPPQGSSVPRVTRKQASVVSPFALHATA